MRLLAAVEGGDGEVDVVRLGVVADGVAVRNEWPETHHAVCVRRHLKGRERGDLKRKRQTCTNIRYKDWLKTT